MYLIYFCAINNFSNLEQFFFHVLFYVFFISCVWIEISVSTIKLDKLFAHSINIFMLSNFADEKLSILFLTGIIRHFWNVILCLINTKLRFILNFFVSKRFLVCIWENSWAWVAQFKPLVLALLLSFFMLRLCLILSLVYCLLRFRLVINRYFPVTRIVWRVMQILIFIAKEKWSRNRNRHRIFKVNLWFFNVSCLLIKFSSRLCSKRRRRNSHKRECWALCR